MGQYIQSVCQQDCFGMKSSQKSSNKKGLHQKQVTFMPDLNLRDSMVSKSIFRKRYKLNNTSQPLTAHTQSNFIKYSEISIKESICLPTTRTQLISIRISKDVPQYRDCESNMLSNSRQSYQSSLQILPEKSYIYKSPFCLKNNEDLDKSNRLFLYSNNRNKDNVQKCDQVNANDTITIVHKVCQYEVFYGKAYKVLQNGDLYQGFFQNRKFHGKGTYTMHNGNKYEGLFEFGQPSGYGRYETTNGIVYEGQWKDNTPWGFGCLKYKDMSYEGIFSNGMKHGNGKLMTDEYTYIGQFQSNCFNGYGQYTGINNEVYKGFWKQNKKNGKGIHILPNGDIYTGYFINNKREGYGQMAYVNGNLYKGHWRNGIKDGAGTLTTFDGQMSGYWVKSQFQGKSMQNSTYYKML